MKKPYEYKCARFAAFKDMIQSFIEKGELNEFKCPTSEYYVGVNHLDNKETSKLNRILGVHKLNKQWTLEQTKHKNRWKKR